MHALIPPLALILERLAGYPDALVRRVGHPVMWMGALIARLDAGLNQRENRRAKGIAAQLILLAVTGLVAGAAAWLCRQFPFGWLAETLLASTLLAQKSLAGMVAAVASAQRRSLAEGRVAVSRIVGRDPAALDEAGVSRAAIESLAESTSDAVIAPLFWLVVLGLPGIALYKAANTADSMVGHRTVRYLEYGWAAARFDDLVNLIPARLSALFIAAVAHDPRAAWATAWRDAKKHESPNAGWPEAAMAGALGFALGGPRSYDGEPVDLPRFGDGRAELGPNDIDRALKLYRAVLNLVLAASMVIAVVVWMAL
jgi:adenosylcobinamide-phosphate synthase